MNDPSPTYVQRTLWATPNTTSSPALPDGPSPCGSPAGPTTVPSPREVVPANHIPRRAKGRATKTRATSGPSGSTGSSASIDLQSALANRLQTLLDTAGSIEFSLTWKEKATPAGRRYCQLQASGRRTSGSGCSGWPSPKAQEDGRTLEQYEAGRLRGYQKRQGKTRGGPASKQGGLSISVQLTEPSLVSPTATPTSHERTFSPRDVDHGQQLINQAALTEPPPTLSPWPTTTVGDSRSARNRTANRKAGEESRHHDGLTLVDAAGLAPKAEPGTAASPWATPQSHDCRGAKTPEQIEAQREKGGGVSNLNEQAQLSSWGTPTTRDHKDAGPAFEADPSIVPVEGRLSRQAPLSQNPLLGPTTESSPAGTARAGGSVLNPAMSRWLMGFCALTHDLSSPHYKEWALIQELLSASNGRPADFWRLLAETVRGG